MFLQKRFIYPDTALDPFTTFCIEKACNTSDQIGNIKCYNFLFHFYKTQNENSETDIILKYENSFSILGLHTRCRFVVKSIFCFAACIC